MNQLTHDLCAEYNKSITSLFTAKHHDYPEDMMALYFNKGMTPEEAVEAMDEEWAEMMADRTSS